MCSKGLAQTLTRMVTHGERVPAGGPPGYLLLLIELGGDSLQPGDRTLWGTVWLSVRGCWEEPILRGMI